MFWRQLANKCRSWGLGVHGRIPRKSLRFCHTSGGVYTRHLSSKIYLQIIGTPLKDTAPSVMLFTDSERYMFNCGENIDQMLHYQDLSFDAGKVFLTGRQWKHIGGLARLHFLPQAETPPGIQILGPKGIAYFMESMAIFKSRSNVPEALIKCTEYNQDEWSPYNDDYVTIKPVLHPTHNDKGTEFSICYICEIADMRGSFSPEKAAALNIPLGPWRNELHRGKVTMLPDGRTIYPDQVVTPPIPGPLFAVIECFSKTTVDSLLSCDKFKQHFDASNNKHFELMVHFTSQSIFENKIYQEWMTKFGSQTTHIVLHENTEACQSPSNIRNRLDAGLCNIDPVLFPVALDKTKPSLKQELPKNCFGGEIGLEYNFFPLKKKGICCDNIYNPNRKRKVTSFKENIRVNSVFHHLPEKQRLDFYNTCVTFLGTAARKQSKMRGTSSILVELSSDCCFILDCGDGTNYQLKRHYGDDMERILSSLSFVFISHIHVDHHMGLVNLILNHMELRRQCKVTKDFVIIGPKMLHLWLQQFSSLTMTDLDYRYYTFNDVTSGNLVTEMRELLCSMNLKKLSLVPVYHCYDSFGIVITHTSDWKLVYSGDCVPSEELCKEGSDATLLIHEATFLLDRHKANNEKHSTINEAIDVAKKMRAHYTILTHFSQRYTLKDLLATPLADRVSLAFDHMSVRLLDLPNLERRQARIRQIFSKKKSTIRNRSFKLKTS